MSWTTWSRGNGKTTGAMATVSSQEARRRRADPPRLPVLATFHSPRLRPLRTEKSGLTPFVTSSRRRSRPRPKPIREPNRCNLEPLKPETPRTALYLVFPRARLTLQAVCPGLVHFRLPVRPPKSPSRPTRDNPGRPCGGRLGGGWCQAPRWHKILVLHHSPSFCLLFTAVASCRGGA